MQNDLNLLVSSVTSCEQLTTSPDKINAAISKSMSCTTVSFEELMSQFTYLLVKEYSSNKTKKVLGYPAFDEDRFVIGFFNHLTPSITANQFIAIEQLCDDFDRITDQEVLTHILKEAICCRSQDIYCITNFDSLHSLLETASANSME